MRLMLDALCDVVSVARGRRREKDDWVRTIRLKLRCVLDEAQLGLVPRGDAVDTMRAETRGDRGHDSITLAGTFDKEHWRIALPGTPPTPDDPTALVLDDDAEVRCAGVRLVPTEDGAELHLTLSWDAGVWGEAILFDAEVLQVKTIEAGRAQLQLQGVADDSKVVTLRVERERDR